MTKRLQLILQDKDYREIQSVARSRHMTVGGWVRRALERARRREPIGDVEKKLSIIRAAAKCNSPAVDIDDMLDEIERGHTAGLPE